MWVKFTVEQIVDAMDRIEELKAMEVDEFCEEAGIKFSNNYLDIHRKYNKICDILIREYGHEMIGHWITVETKLDQLESLFGEPYTHPLEHLIKYESYPIVSENDVKYALLPKIWELAPYLTETRPPRSPSLVSDKPVHRILTG
jgi:hypothetical protein